MSKIKFSGIYSALPTPLAEDGTVNAEVAIRLMRDQLAQGVKGFYVAGGTGEGVLLHKEQRMAIAETAVEACRGRGQVIVHTGAINVEDALELTRHAFSRPRWKKPAIRSLRKIETRFRPSVLQKARPF